MRALQRLTRKTFAVAAIVCLASCGSSSKVTSTAGLFAVERDVYIDGSPGFPPPRRLATLEPGAVVTVLHYRQGQNYSACYVRTQSSSTGWVRCTSLDFLGPPSGTRTQ